MSTSLAQKISKKEFVAIDRGSELTKCLRLSCQPEQVSIKSAVIVPTEDLDANWIKDQGLSGFAAVCPFSSRSMIIKDIDLPDMPKDELIEAIHWHLASLTETAIDDYIIRYSIISGPTEDSSQTKVMAYAVSKQEVKELSGFLKSLQLKPILIEPSVVSLIGCWDFLDDRRSEGSILFLDFGKSHTQMAIGQNRRLILSRNIAPLPDGGAENTKPYYEWAVELQNGLDSYAVNYSQWPIQKIYLAGGSFFYSSIGEYLTQNLGIPTGPIELSERALLPADIEGFKPALFAQALGAARWPEEEEKQ
jgi:Tfp pilus assembly PilM family ATPase